MNFTILLKDKNKVFTNNNKELIYSRLYFCPENHSWNFLKQLKFVETHNLTLHFVHFTFGIT